MTGTDGYFTASYRYNAYGEMTFGKPQYENVYGYNGESYNPNLDGQYLRARYYHVEMVNFFTEDSYLGNIREPLSLNRYNYVYSSYLNYIDPSGHWLNPFESIPYDPDPTHHTTIFDTDVFNSSEFLDYITNGGSLGLGVTAREVYEFDQETHISERLLWDKYYQAVSNYMGQLCDIRGYENTFLSNPIFVKTLDHFGFMYDDQKKLFYTRKNSIQKHFGFNDGIDIVGPTGGMNLDTVTFTLNSNEANEQRIQLWKGQYLHGAAIGGEIGLYKYSGQSFLGMKQYESLNPEEWLEMKYNIFDRRTGKLLLSRNSKDYEKYYKSQFGKYAGRDWWLAGFKLHDPIEPENLLMKSDIKINKKELLDAWIDSISSTSATEHDNIIDEIIYKVENEVKIRIDKVKSIVNIEF